MPSASDLRNRRKFSHFPKNISVISHLCLIYKELYRRVSVQNMVFYYYGRPWPAVYINFVLKIHQIQVLAEPLCRAQASFYALPNNERGTK